MLQRDYILEIIDQFVKGIMAPLRLAVENGDELACQDVERQVGELLELNPETALTLSPNSLVTMMVLSGMGDSVANYVAYSLECLAEVYEANGDEDHAGLRRLQAQAIGESFNCDPLVPPVELEGLDKELFGEEE